VPGGTPPSRLSTVDWRRGCDGAPPRWAPPPIRRGEGDLEDWRLLDPDTADEAAARAEVLTLLPTGAVPMNVDAEWFGDAPVHAVVALLPAGYGVAGVGRTPAVAWRALAERQRGLLSESAVWYPPMADWPI
jgi:hypothetical protein